MPEFSSFGQGKKIRPKKSLMWLLHEALQLSIVNFFFCILNQDLCSMGLNFESVGEILKCDYFTYSY